MADRITGTKKHPIMLTTDTLLCVSAATICLELSGKETAIYKPSKIPRIQMMARSSLAMEFEYKTLRLCIYAKITSLVLSPFW